MVIISRLHSKLGTVSYHSFLPRFFSFRIKINFFHFKFIILMYKLSRTITHIIIIALKQFIRNRTTGKNILFGNSGTSFPSRILFRKKSRYILLNYIFFILRRVKLFILIFLSILCKFLIHIPFLHQNLTT